MLVLGRAGGEEQHPRLVRDGRQHLRELLEVLLADAPAGVLGPHPLLVDRQPVDRDLLPVAQDDLAALDRIGCDRNEPARLAHQRLREPAPALPPPRRAGRDERTGVVHVDPEQRVDGDGAVGVRRRGLAEVDHHARLLAAVQAHDAADPLLVDALRGRRREVHADRRTGRVPALREQLRVDEHVDLATLVGGQRVRELARRRAPGDRGGLQPDHAHRSRDALGVVDAGAVDDARLVAEHVLVVHGRRHVQRVVVERLGQFLLVVVAADDAHAAHRGAGPDAHRPQRCHDAALDGLGQREVGHLGREDVADVLLQQLVGGRHADVRGRVERPDRGRGLVAERCVRLVAQHDAVHVAVQELGVADEPGVRLDRDRRRRRPVPVVEDRLPQPVAVAVRLQVALELLDQQPAVREDQDAGDLRGVDEARRGHRLAGRRGVLEPVPADGARVVDRLSVQPALARVVGRRRLRVVVLGLLVLVVALVLVLVVAVRLVVVLELVVERQRQRRGVGRRLLRVVGERRRRIVVVAVAVLVRRGRRVVLPVALCIAEQRAEHAGQGVDLVGAQLEAVGEVRTLLGQDPLEAEHEREPAPPLGRRRGAARLDLDQRLVVGGAERGTGCKRYGRVVAGGDEAVAGPALDALELGRRNARILRRLGGDLFGQPRTSRRNRPRRTGTPQWASTRRCLEDAWERGSRPPHAG